MHKKELKDEIKELFGDGTESEYLRYFTSRFPRLLVNCYNALEKDLLAGYFYLNANELAVKLVNETNGMKLEGSKLTVYCKYVTTFPETNIQIDYLRIEHISLFSMEKIKSFCFFLQKNGFNVTQLEFFSETSFDPVDKVLQKLPNLMEIKFDSVKYEASITNQTIQPSTCPNLMKLEFGYSNLLQAFQKCQTIQKLKVYGYKITLEEILEKYPSLEELDIWVDQDYPFDDQRQANFRTCQLKVLRIALMRRNEEILEKLLVFIQKQNNLHELYFNTSMFILHSQIFCSQLAAHICQLERLSILETDSRKLLEEIEAFVANCPVANTRLEKLKCLLGPIKSPSLFFEHFTSLRKLDINCLAVDELKMNDLITFINTTQLTSITVAWFPSAHFHLLQEFKVKSLQVLVIHILNLNILVPAFDILQEFLPRHPNITEFKIDFNEDYDEPKSLELIPMVVRSLPKLERLEVVKCTKITPKVINQIAALKMLKYWKINGLESETFYKMTMQNILKFSKSFSKKPESEYKFN